VNALLKSIDLFKNNYFILILTGLLISCGAPNKNPFGTSQFIKLENWHYRIGDSPTETSGKFLWISESLNSDGWKAAATSDEILSENSSGTIWLRMTLPAYKLNNPVLYLGAVEKHMQVYLNNKLLYQTGEITTVTNLQFLGWHQNLVPLPARRSGDVLTLRIRYGSSIDGPPGVVLIGNAADLYQAMFMENSDDFVFGSIFFFIGLAAVIIYAGFQRTKLILAIALFLIPISIFIAANSSFLQMLFNAPLLFYQADHFSLYAASIGGIYSMELIVADNYKKIVRIIWMLLLFYMAGDLLSNMFIGVTHPSNFMHFLVLLCVSLIAAFITIFLSIKKGDVENKILLIGMIIFILFAVMEVMIFVTGTKDHNFGYSANVIHFGVLFYVISLISIIVHKYAEANRGKEKAQKEALEAAKRESRARAEFSSRLIESQETERKRIAGELHDSIGQDIIIAKSMLTFDKNSELGNIENVNEILSKTARSISEISHNLRPLELDELGLTTTLESMIDRIDEITDIEFDVRLEDIDDLIDEDNRINFFRIVQEALNNIVKHSAADMVSIYASKKEDFFILTIHDNGKGFDISKKNSGSRPHFGISAMKERASLINGKLSIASGEKNGTKIALSIRLNRESLNGK
jgi:signal transduction histidine kinase